MLIFLIKRTKLFEVYVIYVYPVFFSSLNIQNFGILLFNNDLKRHTLLLIFITSVARIHHRRSREREEVSVENVRRDKR